MANDSGQFSGNKGNDVSTVGSAGNKDTSTANTRGASAGSSGAAGTTSGTGGAVTASGRNASAGAGEAKEKEPAKVAIVAPEKKTTKKKTTAKKKAAEKEPAGVKSADISKVIVSISDVVASRPKQAHWKITEKEAKSIAEPLANLIEKSNVFSKLAEHSDSIALATACITVVAPRAMMSFMQFKAESEVKKHVKKFNAGATTQQNTKSAGGNAADGGQHNSAAASHDETFIDALYATVDQQC